MTELENSTQYFTMKLDYTALKDYLGNVKSVVDTHTSQVSSIQNELDTKIEKQSVLF